MLDQTLYILRRSIFAKLLSEHPEQFLVGQSQLQRNEYIVQAQWASDPATQSLREYCLLSSCGPSTISSPSSHTRIPAHLPLRKHCEHIISCALCQHLSQQHLACLATLFYLQSMPSPVCLLMSASTTSFAQHITDRNKTKDITPLLRLIKHSQVFGPFSRTQALRIRAQPLQCTSRSKQDTWFNHVRVSAGDNALCLLRYFVLLQKCSQLVMPLYLCEFLCEVTSIILHRNITPP